jgi:hypothetical protein
MNVYRPDASNTIPYPTSITQVEESRMDLRLLIANEHNPPPPSGPGSRRNSAYAYSSASNTGLALAYIRLSIDPKTILTSKFHIQTGPIENQYLVRATRQNDQDSRFRFVHLPTVSGIHFFKQPPQYCLRAFRRFTT